MPKHMRVGSHMSDEEKFWFHTEKAEGCWVWTAQIDAYGYGRIWIDGRDGYAHRYSYRLHFGDIPDGLLVCHSCDNPSCVRPSHLYVGTQQDNMNDYKARGNYPAANVRRLIPGWKIGKRQSG